MTERQHFIRKYSKIAEKRIANNECPVCGKPKSEWNRRTDWRCCSKTCTENFYEQHDESLSWNWVRARVFKRDNYICAKCGRRYVVKYDGVEYADSSNLICDHIVPLAMDGEMWNMDNLQTLCIECNKIKTAQDLKNIAEYKRIKDKKTKHRTFEDIYTKKPDVTQNL